jgi:hypothetical protein
MTENGDPSGSPGDENAIAERVNGILKADFRLNRIFKSQAEAMIATEAAVHNYNTLRSHMSCDYLTSHTAHILDQPLQKHWKKKSQETFVVPGNKPQLTSAFGPKLAAVYCQWRFSI